jgi:uncharacterized protein (DUF1501 family)
MNRRKFIQNTGLAMAGTIFVPSFLRALPSNININNYKRLVVIQLSGGNDGLNTIVPIGQDPYFKLRPELYLKENEYIKINNEFAINKNLEPLRPNLDNGEWAIISDVGYPNPNRSHSRSMDIWQSASNSNEYLSTGWLGRYFDNSFSSSSQVLEIDGSLSLANMGINNKAISFTKPLDLHKALHMGWIDNIANQSRTMLAEDNLGYLYQMLGNVHETSTYLKEKYDVRKEITDFTKGKLSAKLKVIAELMSARIDTKVFYTSMGGFDTHVNQKNTQSQLLKDYSTGVSEFIAALKKENLFDDTLILTFSEFGRRVKQNASRGTDHGTANPVFLMGGKLKKSGLINGPSNLSNLAKNDLIYREDFRSIYSEIIDKWLDSDSSKIITQAGLNKNLGIL